MNQTVIFRQFDTDEAEASGIAEAIKNHAGECTAAKYSDYAVLARTRAVAYLIGDTLEHCGIPVRRKRQAEHSQEWTHAQAAVRALHLRTPDAVLRWLRCRMNEREVEIIKENQDRGTGMNLVALYIGDLPQDDLWFTLSHLGVADAEIERIGELWASLTEKTLPNLALAMAQVKADEETAGEGVWVGTVHGAKGKEWPFVVIAGCEEGIMPSSRSDIEEERRVFFVGMTRARRSLWLTCARQRCRWRGNGGQGSLSEMEPSRFIAECGL